MIIDTKRFLIQPGNVMFRFPRDHGSHNDFKIEWWHFVADIWGDNHERFRFQLTFFRNADFGLMYARAGQQLFFAHAAIQQYRKRLFSFEEKLTLGSPDDFVSTAMMDIRHADWSAKMLDNDKGILRVKALINSRNIIDLKLEPKKPMVILGKNGLVNRGNSGTSHYLTFTRLKAVGSVQLGSKIYRVQGNSWFDHEYSSTFNFEKNAGWDWVGIQLDDGRDIVAGQMLARDGITPKESDMCFISEMGESTRTKFKWKKLQTWKSSRTQLEYPSSIHIITSNDFFELRPLAIDQEQVGQKTGIIYWEGICDVFNKSGDLIGRGFLEMVRDLKGHR